MTFYYKRILSFSSPEFGTLAPPDQNLIDLLNMKSTKKGVDSNQHIDHRECTFSGTQQWGGRPLEVRIK